MTTNRQNTPIRTKPWVSSPISTEEFGELEREYVLRVLEKRRVFRFFKSLREESEADKLEQLYRERLGVNHALAVNSGTSALITKDSVFSVISTTGTQSVLRMISRPLSDAARGCVMARL